MERRSESKVSQAEWDLLIAEFQAGTLSLPRFAKNKGVPYQALKMQLKSRGISNIWQDRPSEERLLILEAYHRSGLSIEEFAGSHGMTAERLREWLKQERSNGERRFHCEWKQMVEEFLASDFLTMSEFARAKKLSPERLKYWMNRYDPEEQWKSHGDEVKQRWIAEFAESGLTAIKFCDLKGIKEGTFRSWLAKWDPQKECATRYAPQRSEEEKLALLAEFEASGKMVKDFAAEKGINKGTLSSWLVNHDPSRRRNDTHHDSDAPETP